MIKTVEWTKEGVRLLDQRLLPNEEKYVTLYSHEEVAEAIKNMTVRGAPAIGVEIKELQNDPLLNYLLALLTADLSSNIPAS